MTAPSLAELGAAILALPPEARRAAVDRGAEWAGMTVSSLRRSAERARWEQIDAALRLLVMVGLPIEDGGPIWVYESSASVSRDTERPWVARITGTSTRFGLRRQFVPALTDWSGAKGSIGRLRGVVHSFPLRAGWVVEISDYVGRRHRLSRWFGRVTESGLVELAREEVVAWAAEQRSGRRLSGGNQWTK